MAENLEHFAIVIGINEYPQLQRLQAAVQDATDFAEWLTSPDGGGLPQTNVRMIPSSPTPPADPFDARPIKKDIDRALRDFGAWKNQRIGQRLYFYFSGHGFGPQFNEVGMVMADAAMDRLNSNVGLQPYREYFYKTALFDEVVFILDCCRDPSPSNTTIQMGAPDFTPQNTIPSRAVQDFVVLAAAWGAKAFERDPTATGERRGLLTRAIMEALKQPEAADLQGRYTDASVREYVRRRVLQLAAQVADEKLRQEPEFEMPRNGQSFVFAKNKHVQKVRVHIVVPEGLGGELILRDSLRREISRVLAAEVTNGQWEHDLIRNQWYDVESTESPPGTPAQIIDLRQIDAEPVVVQFKTVG